MAGVWVGAWKTPTISPGGFSCKTIACADAYLANVTLRIPPGILLVALSAALAGGAWFLFHLWSPERQAELHTLNLLRLASSRDWSAVAGMMSPGYSDDWNHDLAGAIDDARQLFGHFFVLEIAPLEQPQVAVDGGTVSVAAHLGVFGSGTPVAEAVMEEVRGLRQPFVFRWTKCGTWPWQWELSRARQE